MDISVITPVYGVEKYIEKSLRSLFTQTKTDRVEFILVNDCTPDNSMEVARRVISDYPDLNIRIVEHQKNQGLAAARQTGISAARGRYMIHIDSDDWCEKNMLEDMYACAVENNADVVVADIYVNYPGKQVYKLMGAPDNGPDCVTAILKGELSGSTCNKLTRRSICTSNNLAWVPGVDIAEDWLIYIKIFSNAKKVVSMPKAYLHYIQNPGSLTNKRLSPSKLKNYIEADRLAYEYLTQKGDIDKYSEYFAFCRASLLNILIGNSRGADQQEYAMMYPDVKHYHITRNAKLPKHYKLALSHAREGRLWVANMVYMAVEVAKNIIR